MKREDKIKLLNALHDDQLRGTTRHSSPSKEIWNSSVYVEGSGTLPRKIPADPTKKLPSPSPTKANPKTFSNLKKNDQKSGNALLA